MGEAVNRGAVLGGQLFGNGIINEITLKGRRESQHLAFLVGVIIIKTPPCPEIAS